MYRATVKVSNKVGMHAQEAQNFVEIARYFRSKIWLKSETKKVSAKSLLGIIAFSMVGGMTVTVETDGTDEEKAGNFIAELIEGKHKISTESLLLITED